MTQALCRAVFWGGSGSREGLGCCWNRTGGLQLCAQLCPCLIYAGGGEVRRVWVCSPESSCCPELSLAVSRVPVGILPSFPWTLALPRLPLILSAAVCSRVERPVLDKWFFPRLEAFQIIEIFSVMCFCLLSSAAFSLSRGGRQRSEAFRGIGCPRTNPVGVSSQHKLGLEHCGGRDGKEQWGEAATPAGAGMVSFPIFIGN